MKMVLLSGGSGKRLWPLSNDTRSKQFLRVMPDGEGEHISMLQRVWGQLQHVGLADHTYICASDAQIDNILHHVGDVKVVIEPSRMDTFPAIALSTLFIESEQASSDLDEILVVAPVDPFVDDSFFAAVAELPTLLAESGADMVLLGVEPTQPSNQYGYIKVAQGLSLEPVMAVDSFVEKPAKELATRLIREGALWNCGVFCFRISFLKQFLRDHSYPDTYETFLAAFSSLPKRSFDHEVVEHTASIVVRPYVGTWKDLGTWGALVEELDVPMIGRGIQIGCESSYVINELQVPVIAKGLNNVVVVASPDGILVADKAACNDIKDAVNEHSVRPMHEERRWGTSSVLEHRKDAGQESIVNSVHVRAGYSLSYHRHRNRDEIWTITEGIGEVAHGNRLYTVTAGDVVHIYKHEWHSIRALQDLRMIEVQRGPEIVDRDIERKTNDWNIVLQECGLRTVGGFVG